MTRKFYALEQYQHGYSTTINGVSADRLHAFDQLQHRNAVCQNRRFVALTRVLAKREAREIYGCALDDLVTEDNLRDNGSPTRLIRWAK